MLVVATSITSWAQSSFSPEDLLNIKTVVAHELSADGSKLIYREITPRKANEEPGAARSKYFVMDLSSRTSSSIFEQGEKVNSPAFTPNKTSISYLKSIDGINQVFTKHKGKEIQLTNSAQSIRSYKWSPRGDAIAYLATEGKTERQKELEKRGYGFIFYEEDVINDQLWIQELKPENYSPKEKAYKVNSEGNVWNYNWDKQGNQLAYTRSEMKLVDQNYMFRKLHVYNLSSKSNEMLIDNEGKLGEYHFSPDGTKIAYAAALDKYDSAISQAYYINIQTKKITNITPKDYMGHISWASFKDDSEIVYLSSEGVENMLYTFNTKNNKRKIVLNSKETGYIFSSFLPTPNFKHIVFTATKWNDPRNLYLWDGKKEIEQITDSNPQLKHKTFGEQEVIKYKARDGQEIEGILLKPVNYNASKKYPLLMLVHGGPESHHSNGWLSRYSEPGQVFANKGYLVAYINYGSSTGYGIPFSKRGYSAPAAKEFDDLADAIDYICKEKGADKNRVGMAGGSYGGYASAWFSTYYTDYIKASCVFVGISNVISKKGTTDIPYEEILVHTGKLLEECWEQSLKASPIYYAHQSKTATLISGGAADTRVHPTQSYELYRRMKVNNHPAVRLVQYPGEGHGNRKQVGQIDFLYRIIDWMDWYVYQLKPLDGEMPPLDISDKYGLDL